MANFGLNYDLATIQGYDALQRRMAAVGGITKKPGLMKQLGYQANREQRKLLYGQVTRRTGFAGRSIDLGAITPTSVATIARSYAVFIDRGTRPHVISPKHAKILAWAANASGRRATGATRSGYSGPMVFARQVHHPGTKARPFMVPGARAAISRAGVADQIVTAWNEAA